MQVHISILEYHSGLWKSNIFFLKIATRLSFRVAHRIHDREKIHGISGEFHPRNEKKRVLEIQIRAPENSHRMAKTAMQKLIQCCKFRQWDVKRSPPNENWILFLIWVGLKIIELQLSTLYMFTQKKSEKVKKLEGLSSGFSLKTSIPYVSKIAQGINVQVYKGKQTYDILHQSITELLWNYGTTYFHAVQSSNWSIYM